MLADQMKEVAENSRKEQTKLFLIDLQSTIRILAENGYRYTSVGIPTNVNKYQVELWLRDNGFKIDRHDKISW